MKTTKRGAIRKRWIVLLAAAACCASLSAGPLTLPASRRLAGPLDSTASAFGDEFFNFPSGFQGRASPGQTLLSGWIDIQFSEPVGNEAEFTLRYDGAGGDDAVAFPGGQTYTLLRNRASSNPFLVNRGSVNLETGEVTGIELHAIFQNSVIARVTRNIRIPFGFLNDYPPVDLPLPLPFSDRPAVFQQAKFIADAGGRITGFEFRGATIAPVTLFPKLGLFPLYSFGENGNFYFANPTGCLPGTPAENCFSEATHAGGLLLAGNAFFHPHFELVTSELREPPVLRPIPPCEPFGLASGAAVAVAGGIYHIGGFDGTSVSRAVQFYSPATNRWQQGPPMLRGVEAAQAAVVGSLLYVFGGLDPDQQLSLDTGQALNTSSGVWSSVKAMPLAVSGGAAAAAGRKIYVIGGWTNDAGGRPVLTNRLQIYDTDSESWSEGAPAPLAVAGAGAVTVGSEIYLINGRTDAGVSNGVYIYSTATGAWRSGPPTLQGVYEAAAGRVGNRIYLVGGRRALDEPADRQRMQILDLSQNRWHQGHEMPVPTAGSGAVVIDGKFFVLGGRIRAGAGASAGAVTDAIQQYDPALGWTLCDSHPFFTSADVLNAASGAAGPAELSPGSRAVILGYNFTAAAQTAPPVRFDNGVFTSDLPTELNGISISIDGAPASLVSVSPDRVEFQIPYSVAGGPRRPVSLQLIRQGAAAQHPPVQITLQEAAPAIYVYNYGEYRETVYLERATAVARHSDGKLIHPSNPARPGETVSIMVTGLGAIVPPLASGQRAAFDPLPQVVLLPKVIIGGREAEGVAATAAPREAGLYEVRAVVPLQTSPSNAVPVEVIVNGVRSNVATLSVR